MDRTLVLVFLMAAVGASGCTESSDDPQFRVIDDGDIAQVIGSGYNTTVVDLHNLTLTRFGPDGARSPVFADEVHLAYLVEDQLAVAGIDDWGEVVLSQTHTRIIAGGNGTVYAVEFPSDALEISAFQFQGEPSEVVFSVRDWAPRCEYIDVGDVSPTGRLLVFSLSCGPTGDGEIENWIVDLHTGAGKEIEPPGRRATFVDEDTLLVVATGWGGQVNRYGISSGIPTTLYTAPKDEVVTRAWPADDGAVIVYAAKFPVGNTRTDREMVFVLDSNGGRRMLLETEAWAIHSIAVSPDASHMAIAVGAKWES